MRYKKIRGHNRIHKHIDNWRLNNISLDNLPLHRNNNIIMDRDRYHAKIEVLPWSRIPIMNSLIPEPTGRTKQEILNGLLDIYESWKKQLDKLGKPYYLKVWLYEPRFSQSQVVFAIGDKVDFYENLFYKPETDKPIKLENYGSLKSKLSKFNWDNYFDEVQYYDNDIIGLSEHKEYKKWFQTLFKKQYRTYKYEAPFDDTTGVCVFKMGEIWIGELK